MIIFGAGTMYGIPQFDALGNAITTPTPIKLLSMQSVSFDISYENKQLYDYSQFPIAIARGKATVTGKASMAQVNGNALNQLIFGQTVNSATGQLNALYYDQNGTALQTYVVSSLGTNQVCALTTFELSKMDSFPALPLATSSLTDLGVIGPNGLPYTKVAAAAAGPSVGQYMVTPDMVYVFNESELNHVMHVSMEYTQSLNTASSLSIKNLPMGYTPTFQAIIQTTYQNQRALLKLYNVFSTKLQLFNTKLDDFSVPDFDMVMSADSAGNVFDLYLSQ
jgi:hypothetical protein